VDAFFVDVAFFVLAFFGAAAAGAGHAHTPGGPCGPCGPGTPLGPGPPPPPSPICSHIFMSKLYRARLSIFVRDISVVISPLMESIYT
jgi:hypothetical protein